MVEIKKKFWGQDRLEYALDEFFKKNKLSKVCAELMHMIS